MKLQQTNITPTAYCVRRTTSSKVHEVLWANITLVTSTKAMKHIWIHTHDRIVVQVKNPVISSLNTMFEV